jgi:hypothetical protein
MWWDAEVRHFFVFNPCHSLFSWMALFIPVNSQDRQLQMGGPGAAGWV